MKNLECIIIEDEFPAREILKGYLNEIPNWTVKSTFDNAIDAISYLSLNEVDVIFVDIKLPRLSGISFIKTLEKPPIIVITTAYSEHAIEAFELVVFDYLLKPYSFERFVKTVNRINIERAKSTQSAPELNESDFIIVKENRNRVKVQLKEIYYLESQKEYVNIICEDKVIKTKMGITKMTDVLPNKRFIRVHRSFIVNLDKVDSFSKKKIAISDQLLPVGRYYQKEVQARLGGDDLTQSC